MEQDGLLDAIVTRGASALRLIPGGSSHAAGPHSLLLYSVIMIAANSSMQPVREMALPRSCGLSAAVEDYFWQRLFCVWTRFQECTCCRTNLLIFLYLSIWTHSKNKNSSYRIAFSFPLPVPPLGP